MQTKQWHDKFDRESSSPSRPMIEKLIDEFKRGRTSTNYAERSGRPIDITTPEIIKIIHDILDDPKVKVREIAEAAGILIGPVVEMSRVF